LKNDYENRGEFTTIFLCRKDGIELETLIDTEDLPRVKEYNWLASWSPHSNSYYVRGYVYKNGEKKDIAMHRLITDAPKHMLVDHVNHDTLDNRKINLRVVTRMENNQNLKGARRNNKSSSIRGVSWHKHVGKWQVRVKVKGVYKNIGYFEELEVAAQKAEEARLEYMPYLKKIQKVVM
jgi:hypothetical protein